MKIFLTGGSGFVGHHLLRGPRAQGQELVASARSPMAAETVLREGARPWRGGLDDVRGVAQALDNCSAVVHAAAHLKFWGPWAVFEVTKVGLTQAQLEAARIAGVPNFVHIGAASVVMCARGPISRSTSAACGSARAVYPSCPSTRDWTSWLQPNGVSGHLI